MPLNLFRFSMKILGLCGLVFDSGSLIDGMTGNIMQFPTYYDLNRKKLNERQVIKNGARS